MDSVEIATVRTRVEEDGINRHAWMKETFELLPPQTTFTFEQLFKLMETGEVVFNDRRPDTLAHAQGLFTIQKRPNAYPDPVEIPEQNMYSQEEINEMILEQTQLIRSQESEVSQAELNWKKAKQTATDGIVRSVQDGTVVAVGDPYAPQGDQALIQVKSGQTILTLLYPAGLLMERKQEVFFQAPVQERADTGHLHYLQQPDPANRQGGGTGSGDQTVLGIQVNENLQLIPCFRALRNLPGRQQDTVFFIRIRRLSQIKTDRGLPDNEQSKAASRCDHFVFSFVFDYFTRPVTAGKGSPEPGQVSAESGRYDRCGS